MRKLIAAALLLSLLASGARAQEVQGKNSTTLFGNLGYVNNVSSFNAPVDGLSRSGPAGSVRIMWHPQFLLAYGVEVGYTARYSVNSTGSAGSIDATNGAWPIFFVLSMSPAKRFLVNAGMGPVISTSSVTALGSSTSTSSVGSGFMASVAYLAPVSPKFDLGGEFRFLRSDTFNDNILSLQFTVAYRLSGK